MTTKLAVKTSQHEVPGSSLYAIASKRRLAELLFWEGAPSALRGFSRRPSNYHRYHDQNQLGKKRPIEAPCARLKTLQKRIESLLKRIKTPAYLHSAIPGRSYLSNSQAHCDAQGCTITMDIANFFPSVCEERIVRMFITMFRCQRDVAEILAGLLCCDGHLATGSPASPIVSFLAYKEVFDRIASRATRMGSVFTLYMDDIGITGARVGEGDIKWATKLLASSGLTVKRAKTKLFHTDKPKLVTGRAFRNGQSRAPNCQHLKMREALALSSAHPHDARLRSSVIGRLRHVALLDNVRRARLRATATQLSAPHL